MHQTELRKSVYPLVRIDSEHRFIDFIGTAYVIEKSTVVTAKHVIIDNPITEDSLYALPFKDTDGRIYYCVAKEWENSREFDIAVARNLNIPGSIPLKISAGHVDGHFDVISYEFSNMSIEMLDDTNRMIHFIPNTHKGNILHYYTSTFPETVPTQCFDTSFPALQGASGAPVLFQQDFAVVGMLVANIERHLIPAQVVKIVDGVNSYEETKYFLPLGKAISAILIIDFLESIGVELMIVP